MEFQNKHIFLEGFLKHTYIQVVNMYTYIQDEFMDVKGVVARILGKKAKLS